MLTEKVPVSRKEADQAGAIRTLSRRVVETAGGAVW